MSVLLIVYMLVFETIGFTVFAVWMVGCMSVQIISRTMVFDTGFYGLAAGTVGCISVLVIAHVGF